LLFTIGLEFSLGGLLRIKRYVLLGGALQVTLTIGASFLILDPWAFLRTRPCSWGFSSP
jgi:CPA2 family monovalent cation:H+ antiporter-2